MCTKLNCRKPYVDFFQGDTSQESTYFSEEFCEEDSITNKLPWDPAAQLLRNREASLQSCLLAQHSPVWPQILLSKQILTILLSFLLIQMQKKNPWSIMPIALTSFYSPYKKSSLWHRTLPESCTDAQTKATVISPLPKILYYATIPAIINLILHYVPNQ